MQLFILDRNPFKAVRMLADVHVRKMCLETAQILSVLIIKRNGTPENGMPEPYNPHHPVVKAIDSVTKINYAVLFNIALQNEFLFRFDKRHKYFGLKENYYRILFIPVETQCDFSFCRNFKDFETKNPDIVGAYREYYVFKKSIIRNWHYTKRKEPDFLL